MEDNFDLGKWKKELILRDYQLNEIKTPEDTIALLQTSFRRIFPQAQAINISVPNMDMEKPEGRIKIQMKDDISKEDLAFAELELEKLDFRLDKNASTLYYDVEPGEHKLYPTLVFTYL